MKTKIATMLLLFCVATGTIKAQDMEGSLKNALKTLNAAKTEPEMLAAASQFDRIAMRWSDQWITNFYAAYSKIMISYQLEDKTKRDQFLDAADVYIDKALKLSANNDEIFILAARSAKARIAVNPQDRWKKYGDVYTEYINKARKIKAENPRIYFLEGQGYFYKPALWGGGKDKAKPYFEKAKALFTQEDHSNVLVPNWGEQENESLLKQCD